MKRGKILKEGEVKCKPEYREWLKREKFEELRPPSLKTIAYEVKFYNTDDGFKFSYYEYFWDAVGVYDFSEKLAEIKDQIHKRQKPLMTSGDNNYKFNRRK